MLLNELIHLIDILLTVTDDLVLGLLFLLLLYVGARHQDGGILLQHPLNHCPMSRSMLVKPIYFFLAILFAEGED